MAEQIVLTGKEILLSALRNEATTRAAWVPFVGVHGGQLIGKTADEYLKSADDIVEGQTLAAQKYQADGIPVVFDLQMEAEVLGCKLHWAKEVPPSVISHPLATKEIEELPEFDLGKGRFSIVSEATQRLAMQLGGETALYGLITGPFTLLSHLRGSDLFMDLISEPDRVKRYMAYCAQIAKATADFYLKNGADVIAVVDPMTSQISPEHFDSFVAPYLNEVFSHIRQRDAFSSLFICGDATRNLEVMCRTTCDNVSIDENIPLNLLRNLAQKYNKSFGGNLKLTTVLLLGKEADCMLEAIRCIDRGGRQGFILAPGCDLPYGVPERNLQAVATMVHDDYQRTVARTSVQATMMDDFQDLELPNYEQEDKVILDVITLDSSACAPCLYMVDAAIKAADASEVDVDVREHKIKSREGIGYMCRLDVQNVPTICIDGKPTFRSQIPDSETLLAAISARYKEKRG
jgi:uroporphyrinogen decarboxylase